MITKNRVHVDQCCLNDRPTTSVLQDELSLIVKYQEACKKQKKNVQIIILIVKLLTGEIIDGRRQNF